MFLFLTKSQIFFGNFVWLIFLKKMIYYTLTLTCIFKVKSSIFLSIFEHEYLANGLVCWNQILHVLAWVKDHIAEKKIQLYPEGFSPGSNLGGAIISRLVSWFVVKFGQQ